MGGAYIELVVYSQSAGEYALDIQWYGCPAYGYGV
jgi:hypothetical protein